MGGRSRTEHGSTPMNRLHRRLALARLTLTAVLAGAALAVSAAPHAFSVALAGGKVQGDDTLKVRQGEQVELRITSDRPLMLHLHGYEIDTKVEPPKPALLSFKADLPGRFPIHEHREGAGNHRAVLFVEVHP